MKSCPLGWSKYVLRDGQLSGHVHGEKVHNHTQVSAAQVFLSSTPLNEAYEEEVRGYIRG